MFLRLIDVQLMNRSKETVELEVLVAISHRI